ncbi:MAG: hypothetical protein ABFE02_12600 [Sulfuricella sp.]
MNRLALLFLLALFHQSSFGAVYKCDQGSGKVEYQATPCANGHDMSIKAKLPASTGTSPSDTKLTGNKKCIGKEIRISFTDMPIKSTLSVLADFSGNKLVVDPSVNGAGAFSYECIPWDTVLQDIASKHNLIVKIENGTIFARKR